MGRTRAYTPTSDDVGYVLKFEVTVIDKLHPYAADLGRTHTQSVCTARVRPAPNPPVRSMVQMVPPSQQSNAGRFTILTYNLLADLYAKVGVDKQARGGETSPVSGRARGRDGATSRGIGA